MREKIETTETESRFNALIEKYGAFLRNAVAKLCPKDLGIHFDDIEQEARLRLWRALEGEREISDLASYIYRITVTTTIDAMRRIKRRREEQFRLAESDDALEGESLKIPSDPDKSPERVAEIQQTVRKVEEVLSSLPEDRRRAVGLYLEGMNSQEIADLMDWTEPKARNLVYRGLKDMRERLKNKGIDYEVER